MSAADPTTPALVALVTMTYGFLRRVGVDPLARLRSEQHEER